MRKLGIALTLTALLLGACTGNERRADNDLKDAPPPATASVHAASLERFDACPEFLSHVRGQALKRVEQGTFASASGDAVAAQAVDEVGSSSTGQSAGPRSAAGASEDASAKAPAGFSGTNVQEENVDEPDIIKTNGRHIFTLRQEPSDPQRQLLTAVAVEGGRPRTAGSVVLPAGASYQLLLSGDRILAISSSGHAAGPSSVGSDLFMPGSYEQETIVAVVDVSDPERMRIANRLVLDGTYSSARLVDGIARVVMHENQVGPALVTPKDGSQGQRDALEENKRRIRNAEAEDWLPGFELQDDSGRVVEEGPLASCASTYHPKAFSGFGTTTVTTIDPENPDPRESASVLGGAGTVYASTQNLYVATMRWPEPQPLTGGRPDAPAVAPEIAPQEAPRTQIHRFDITDPQRAVYSASGEVSGTVLNQWSMSEHRGHLRVATTEDRFDERGGNNSSSSVTVFDATTPRLTKVGSVGGLGKTERIYGVRFMGGVGYVVTFRQVDPLYVLDLSDAAKPRLLGELKIPGYSAYLHPVGEGMLLGIGQDATTDGRAIGTQVSLFDVRDPASPKQLDKIVVRGASSPVEHDHHAFTWWAPTQQAIIPIDTYDKGKGTATFTAYSLRVADGNISGMGRLTHAGHTKDANVVSVQRSMVVDDALFTLSAAGVLGSDLRTLDERGFAPFPPYGR